MPVHTENKIFVGYIRHTCMTYVTSDQCVNDVCKWHAYTRVPCRPMFNNSIGTSG